MRKHLAYAGLCLGILTFAAGIPTAQSQVVTTEDISVEVQLPTPDVILTPMSFGGVYYAFAAAGTQATATVTTAGALTNSTGTPGNARLVPIDIATIPPAPMTMTVGSVTPGVPSATMSLAVEDDNAPGTVPVTLSGTVPDETFVVNTWTAAIQGGDGALSGFNGTSGLGTLTLSASGTATLNFGGRLNTVTPASTGYTAQVYTGTVRITINY